MTQNFNCPVTHLRLISSRSFVWELLVPTIIKTKDLQYKLWLEVGSGHNEDNIKIMVFLTLDKCFVFQ